MESIRVPTYRWGTPGNLRSPNPSGTRDCMPVFPDSRKSIDQSFNRNELPTSTRPQSPSTTPHSRPIADPQPASSSNPARPHRIEIPERYIGLEQPPLSAFDDNPVFNEYSAAQIVGVSAECLKKWRQRNQGPDYIQYGRSGPVRYELNALMAFRATYRVEVGKRG